MNEREDLCRLVPLTERQATRYGMHTHIDGLTLSCFTRASEPFVTVQHPVYSVVLQGEKEAMICDQLVRYTAGQSLIAGVDLPVTSRIVEATTATPYLAISVALDLSNVAELIGNQAHGPAAEAAAPFGVMDFDPALADPLARLLELLDRPADVPVLAPMINREIVWRLLHSPFAPLLQALAWPEGNIARIGRATQWIRENVSEPLRVAELAERVNMSVPSFHRHFKTVTTVSPLQFQKQMRLHIARKRLLAAESVAAVAYNVGYESLSQFNRDYRKFYGLAPTQDVATLRQELRDRGSPNGAASAARLPPIPNESTR
ncbi:AraC family transcriptional regulator [Acuticoccus sediminis]|uniref:AraC family transcriptional regulator n=1 Tax=Acuticoccus sediminis TaxID=2184697 RepID=UPI001CFDCCD6|nr:AraC family transcriptional regulator [Acuticoccus sediminis]